MFWFWFFNVFPQLSAHLLYFLQVLVGRQKLLALKLFLERSESLDAVRLEEGLEIGALRRLFARRLRSLFLETMRERHLGNVIQSDGDGTSRIVEREETHFLSFKRCVDCVAVGERMRARTCARVSVCVRFLSVDKDSRRLCVTTLVSCKTRVVKVKGAGSYVCVCRQVRFSFGVKKKKSKRSEPARLPQVHGDQQGEGNRYKLNFPSVPVHIFCTLSIFDKLLLCLYMNAFIP